MSGRSVRLALAACVSAGLLWVLLQQLDFTRLIDILGSASWPWLFAAILALACGYALRIRRWQMLLRAQNPQLRWIHCAGPLLAGFATNNVLPFRAGDAMRCVAFRSSLGVSEGAAAASLLLERLLDALALLAALGIALASFELASHRFFTLGGAALGILAALLMLMIAVPRVLGPVLHAAAAILAFFFPAFGARLKAEALRAMELLESSAKGQRLLALLGLSALAWCAEGAVFYCVARSLSALEAPRFAWLALPVATLATLLPGTPGHLGTFDFFAAEAMQAGGNAALAAAAFALLVHFVLWLPVTCSGGLWLWRRHR